MVNDQHTFVFVVCGEKPYIDSLNIAIRYLKAFSKSNIRVITDSRRNAANIDCDNVTDIATNPDFNHHEASVFLKTSLHRYLDMDAGRYCYLDSDVLAISDKTDEVFNENHSIIGFCADNMTLDLFSPYAMNCGCLERARENEQKLRNAAQQYAEKLNFWKEFVEKNNGDVLIGLIAETKKAALKNIIPLGRFAFQKACPFCKTASLKGYSYDKSFHAWKNAAGEIILYPLDSYYEHISGETGFRFDDHFQFWCDGGRRDVCIPCCTHLHRQIRAQYGIGITPDQWQHWNGGLFLFDKRSVDFLEYWHEQTMSVFKSPDWKTRDQGTLALSAWKFGLQKQKCLDSRFNYILDHHKPGLGFNEGKGFTRDGAKTWDQPELVHVYHRFGDENWDIWQYLLKIVSAKQI